MELNFNISEAYLMFGMKIYMVFFAIMFIVVIPFFIFIFRQMIKNKNDNNFKRFK